MNAAGRNGEPIRGARRWVPIVAIGIVTIAAASLVRLIPDDSGCQRTRGKEPPVKTFAEEPAEKVVFVNRTYTAKLETSDGTIKIALHATTAPRAVNNFVFLAREGYYDGTEFHRVVDDENGAFIQGGDASGTGSGNAGYTFEGDPPPLNADVVRVRYPRGSVLAANAGSLSSTGSQFVIVARDWTTEGRYTSIGSVRDAGSIRVVDEIAASPGSPWLSGLGVRPNPAVTVSAVEIEECTVEPSITTTPTGTPTPATGTATPTNG